ncbi:uncharacterized protein [Montipora capricornis]|uniref:uncharacterized protein n=1 Tax=Montipora capricornis TaxID=246305 RepID=UPI0035F1ABFD
MKDFFKNGLDELQSGGTSPNAQQACKRLNNFLSHVPETLDHLKKCKKEEDFNCLFALEVLIPLSSGTCLIDQKSTAGRKEERLKLPNEFGKKGLVIGYSCGYHGELDMVVIPDYQEDLPVLIASEEERPRPTPKQAKKAKTETLEEYIEALHRPISLSTLSRSVAMIITFSHMQKECFKTSCAVPMLRVNPKGVLVLVYDSHKDILLISEVYEWDGIAFLVIWLVLHYSLFPPSVLSDSLVDCCCGYNTAIKDTKLGEPWYLESESVLDTEDWNTLFDFMRTNIKTIQPGQSNS